MSKKVIGMITVVALLASGTLFAGKIGFVDAERAVAQVDQGKAKVKEMQEWGKPIREEIDSLTEELKALQEKITKQAAVLDEETLRQLRDDETRMRRQLEDKRRDFQRQIDAKTDEFMKDVAYKVGVVASDYGKANDYDAIFILTAQPLIYLSEESELTDTVIRLYNERFPVQ